MKVGGGRLPSFLSVSSCALQPSPLWWPHLRRCQAMGAGGWARRGAAQETGNHEREIEREREEATGVRGGGGGGHDESELPQLLGENDRERKWEAWVASPGGLSVPITSP